MPRFVFCERGGPDGYQTISPPGVGHGAAAGHDDYHYGGDALRPADQQRQGPLRTDPGQNRRDPDHRVRPGGDPGPERSGSGVQPGDLPGHPGHRGHGGEPQ